MSGSAITCRIKGNFKKTNSFLERCLEFIKLGQLDYYGRMGVKSLAENTPIDTGLAASSWRYEIKHTRNKSTLTFCNDDIENGYNVAILIAYGHGTRNGVYVPGVDYISPAMQPVFISIAEYIRREIDKL